MSRQLYEIISGRLNIPVLNISNTIKLINDGCTIPFISRYRKEFTYGLDEVQISDIKFHYQKLLDICKRKETILKTIEDLGQLTDALKDRIDNCFDSTELEDLYLPYKPRRRTRASIAKENGLEPLAKILMLQHDINIIAKAESFMNDKVTEVEEVLKGARDIIAEMINENTKARCRIRQIFEKEASISSSVIHGKEEIGLKYSDYFKFTEQLKKSPSHRVLAIRRGEAEGCLSVSIFVDEKKAVNELKKIFIKANNDSAEQVIIAIEDSYKRLISPSIENEFASGSKEKADIAAIKVFSDNLRQLLLAPPLGQKRVLAIDPGYKNGCKIVCLDEEGNLLHNDVIYPHKPHNEQRQSGKKIVTAVNAYKIDAIAIGNGTASRETEEFIQNLKFTRVPKTFIVSENGASVYSVSPVAREEFPLYSVEVRGAVSIGRRLMDPLAELVKIDPKSIGVGQYQHDVDQNLLQKALDEVVEQCVNLVGVNVNTASKHILTYISGIGPQLAENIVNYRKENGKFLSRSDLKEVPRMGDKSFEQAAGFLKIVDGFNPLDNTFVHPESYLVVEKMAKELNCQIFNLIKNKELMNLIDPLKFIDEKTGLPTVNDILNELEKPGLDPRKSAKYFEFAKGIYKIEDLKLGMILPGVVTNITNFGVFVDIGVKQDGLVHISNIKNEFITSPSEAVALHQHISVKIIDIDIPRKRIQLSMKDVN